MADARNVLIIDDLGRITVEGSGTRLAPLVGRYRFVPSPPGLLVLQRAGESAPDAARVVLAGEIDRLGGLVDIIQFIETNRWSGQLSVLDGSARKSLTFQAGEVASASSNLASDRLGALLYRYGVVSEEVLEEVMRTAGSAKIGQLLVERGVFTVHDLYQHLRKQVEEIFHSLLVMRQGDYYFQKAAKDAGSATPLQLSTRTLLFDGVRRIDEFSYFREKLPSSEIILDRRTPRPDARLEAVEERVLALVDGRRDVGAVARLSQLGEFDALKILFRLLQSGFVETPRKHISLRLPTVHISDSLSDKCGKIVDTFNTVYAKVYAAINARGAAGMLEKGLRSFFVATSDFAPLFVGIYLASDGTVPKDLLLANLEILPAVDKLDYLQRALDELLYFEVFTAGESVDTREEAELQRRIKEILREPPTSG